MTLVAELIKIEVNGTAPTAPVKVMSPAPAVKVRACAPLSVLLNVIPLPLLFTFTAPLESVAAPVTVRPTKPLQFMPSKLTAPANVLAVLPGVRVTSCWNLVEPAPLVETIPLAPPTVLRKSTRPVEFNVIAAPVPSPMFVTAPVNIVVPAPVPAAMVRSRLLPVRLLLNRIAPPLESNETAPVVNATVLLKVILPVVVKFTLSIVAKLATVNALLKAEELPEKNTPNPPAVRVVMPEIIPPVVTPDTVIVPPPAAVMFNEAAVMKPKSALLISKPTAAVPNPTFTAALLVMLTTPVPALIAA